MSEAKVTAIHAGRIAPLGPNGVPSAFVKSPVSGGAYVGVLGLAGDEQADLTVHGGRDKAVYAYAQANYDLWRTDFPELADKFGPGSVGENLAIEGMSEKDMCVGDVHAIGGALLQVCQPRQPCFKFALRFEDERLPPAMMLNGRSGWYYRVLQEGGIGDGESVRLHARPNPDFPFQRLVEIISRRRVREDEATRLASMDGLAAQWREYFSSKKPA
ncbi:MAG: MOSC domain-containing protein [Caulobacterales bacterium]